MISTALAVHDTGVFQLDGDAATSTNTAGTPPATDDWDKVCHQVTGADCSTTSNTSGATAVSWTSDGNLNSTIFTGGGSKDINDISQWQWNDNAGGLPAKDNLLHAFAARYTTSEGPVLFFGSDRYDNSGDAQQGFWFFQNPVNLTPAGGSSGTFTGVHKNGDLLVLSDFSIGGTVSTISVYEWDTGCTAAANNNPQPGQCGAANLRLEETSTSANCKTAAANDNFCGIVNPSTITMPWSFTDKSGTANNGALNGEFYEGGVNLQALGLGNTCFSSVAAETRSSTSPTAVLKDFVLGGFGACTSSLSTAPTAAGPLAIPTDPNSAQISVSDKATVSVQGVSSFSGTVHFHLCGPLDATSTTADCASGGVDVGSTPVTANGTVTSPTATVSAAGQYCWRGEFSSTTSGVPPAMDASHNECFIVTPATPTLATTAGAGPVQLGNPITDTATLSGTAHEPGTDGPAGDSGSINASADGGDAAGTITFTLFKGSDCTNAVFTSTPVSVAGDGTYGPVSFTPTSTGTYHWAATYTGDGPNTNGTSHNTSCNDTGEDVTVTDTTAATSAQTWVPNDTGTITSQGGAALNGTLTIQLYDGATCAAGSEVSGQLYTRTLTNATSPASLTTSNTSFTVSTSKSVSWLVTFTSTDANVAGSSHCEHTDLTITN